MNRDAAKRTVVFALIALLAILVDQITKLLAFYYLPDPTSHVWIIEGWLGFSHEENDAIAFGIGSGNRAFMTVVLVVTVVLVCLIPFIGIKTFRRNVPAQVCLALIEGGAAGNLIDRLLVKNAQGVAVVRDFVDLTRFGFANCNVADFCVTLGAVALVIVVLFIGPQAAFPLKKKWREQAQKEAK